MAYETLNRLKWTGRLDRAVIVILHRGAKNNRKSIAGAAVTEVRKSYFSYQEGGKETTIPFHRVGEILCDGKVIWRRHAKNREALGD
jgi:uncharacterized protein (UPF0248 family)